MSDALPAKSTHRHNRELHMRLLADLAQDLSGDINFPTSLDLALRMRGVLSQPNITFDGFTRAVTLHLKSGVLSVVKNVNKLLRNSGRFKLSYGLLPQWDEAKRRQNDFNRHPWQKQYFWKTLLVKAIQR